MIVSTSLSLEKSIFRFVPEPLVLEIFKFASPETLARISCVCRRWKELASKPELWNAFDVQKLFPKLEIFNEAVWEKYRVQLNLTLDASPLDKRVFIPAIFIALRKDKTPTLLYMPQGLTRNKLVSLTTGFGTLFADLGDISVKESYWTILAHSPIHIDSSPQEPSKSLGQLVKENDPQIFSVLEEMTCLVLRSLNSQKKLPYRVVVPLQSRSKNELKKIGLW